MATEELLDFERLLAAIPGEQASGVELRDDSEGSALFFQVKELRDAARTSERQLLHWYGDKNVDKPDPPNWRGVLDVSEKIICEKSKDLWVLAWLLEAIVRIHGFAGLRDGFRLIRETSERYWDQIHPSPDEDGYTHTVSQLTGVFEGALAGPIHAIPITPATTSQRALSGVDYTDAYALEQLDASSRAARIENGAATLDMFQRVVQPVHEEYFRKLLDDIDQAMNEFELLTADLEQRCGTDESGYSAAPPSSGVREAIRSARDQVRSLTRDLLAPDATGGGAAEEAAADSSTPEGTIPGGAGWSGEATAIRSREDAFRALLRVADFFRRTEPHSPVSYALEQAVRWGRMPFPELMQELIDDENARRDMFRRAGVTERSEESN
jgi:type VI secretion system protein ImpA